MAVNIKGGELTVVVANQNANIADTGLGANNMLVMFLAEGNPYPSYNPNSGLNLFDQIIKDKVYLVRGTIDMDNPFFYQGIPVNSNGNSILMENGSPILPE